MREHHTVDVTGMTGFKNQVHFKDQRPWAVCVPSSPQVTVPQPQPPRAGLPGAVGAWLHPGPDRDKRKLGKGKPYEDGGERREWGDGKEREMTAPMTKNALQKVRKTLR